VREAEDRSTSPGSCTSRVTTDYETLRGDEGAGCRLLIVGTKRRPADSQETSRRARPSTWRKRFTENAHKLGLKIHADFIVGLPGETRDTIRNTIDFAKRLDCETIQVSIAHAYPGTEFYDFAKKNAHDQHWQDVRRPGPSVAACPVPGHFSKSPR
jgi:hypothetical protein